MLEILAKSLLIAARNNPADHVAADLVAKARLRRAENVYFWQGRITIPRDPCQP
ncbi:MAG: hypothetical protein KGH84_09850 [Paracoccaceae bacterium]|nr:hypothetical protein [Paracoccaceae bacterium]